MTKYECTLQGATDRGLQVIENLDIDSESAGLIYGNTIGLHRRLWAYREKACVLAEEIAHHDVNVGNITDQNDTNNRWQEHKARTLAYDRLIGLCGLIQCFKAGDRNLYEMAERLEVSEAFLHDALYSYKLRYGEGIQVDNFWVSFEPYFDIAEMID